MGIYGRLPMKWSVQDLGDSLRAYNKTVNLMSDYCYSVLVDDLDRVWVGHDREFSRYDIGTDIMKTFGEDLAETGFATVTPF